MDTIGLTVAGRLAENPKFSILVIEAGPNAEDDPIVNQPGQYVPHSLYLLKFDTIVICFREQAASIKYTWGYNTTVQSAGDRILTVDQCVHLRCQC